jgi:ribosomal-protein-alanine N-acetyltransferase
MMQSSLLIEPMLFADLGQVLEIENSSFLSPWSPRLFEEELQNPRSRVFLLKHQTGKSAKITGFLCLWLVTDEAHILKIAVRPSERRRGIASALLQFALDYCYQRNIARAVLEVREHNLPARCFYGAWGFSLLGVRPRYYDDTKEDALIMGLHLGGFAENHLFMSKRIPETEAT